MKGCFMYCFDIQMFISVCKLFLKMQVYQKNLYFCKTIVRGRAVVARRAHNPEVAGSSPAPATWRCKNI